MTLASRFHSTFPGYDRLRLTGDAGVLTKNKDAAGLEWEKLKVTTHQVNDPVTEAHWQRHLDGIERIGIGPALPGGDTCQWGTIDVDSRDAAAQKLEACEIATRLKELRVPALVIRSKSPGGFHIFVFAKQPVPCRSMRAILIEVRKALGLRESTEIYPEKDAFVDVHPQPVWFPYFGCLKGTGGTEKWIRSDNTPGSPEECLDVAALLAQEPGFFDKPMGLPMPVAAQASPRQKTPPAYKHGHNDGSGRNNALLSALGLYAKMPQADFEGGMQWAEKYRPKLDPPPDDAEWADWDVPRMVRYCLKKEEGRQRASETDLLGFLRNDSGNADRLLALHQNDLRFCFALKKWLVWDDCRWVIDEGGIAELLVQSTLREYLRQAVDAADSENVKFALRSLNSHPLSNVLTVARSHVSIKVEELDNHPDLIAFENGIVDLRTGELRSHDRGLFLTKIVHFEYKPEAPCPLFEKFIGQVMCQDPVMVDYMHRALGYSMTGHTREKAAMIAYGEGDNGKTTLLDTVSTVVFDFSARLDVETLTLKRGGFSGGNNQQADLADLRGARFVMTSEGEENQFLSQSTLKKITQGTGSIKACRKYENPIAFPETHKLWMDTNFRPRLRAADDKATLKRLHLIPFDLSLKPEQIDTEFQKKLLAEAEGILAWLVRGAAEWYRRGLSKPAKVEAALAQWSHDDDQLTQFIESECVIGANMKVGARPIYVRYKEWSEEVGETPISETLFGTRMAKRPFDKVKINGIFFYQGLGLRSNNPFDGTPEPLSESRFVAAQMSMRETVAQAVINYP